MDLIDFPRCKKQGELDLAQPDVPALSIDVSFYSDTSTDTNFPPI